MDQENYLGILLTKNSTELYIIKVKEEKKDMDNMGNNNMEQKNNIMENGVDNKIIKKNQVFNSSFVKHEEEKNNSEIIEKKAPQNNLDNKKKLKFNLFFNDDDE